MPYAGLYLYIFFDGSVSTTFHMEPETSNCNWFGGEIGQKPQKYRKLGGTSIWVYIYIWRVVYLPTQKPKYHVILHLIRNWDRNLKAT